MLGCEAAVVRGLSSDRGSDEEQENWWKYHDDDDDDDVDGFTAVSYHKMFCFKTLFFLQPTWKWQNKTVFFFYQLILMFVPW